MSKIAIIKTTSHPVADRIFAGVYGTLTRDMPTEEGSPESLRMSIAPEFRSISVLFTYLDNGQVPVQLNEIAEIEVAPEHVNLMQNQIMLSLKNRWKTMYSKVAPAGGPQSDMLSAMVQGEANSVDSAIAARFAVQGVREYCVAVHATMASSTEGAFLANEQELLSDLAANSASAITVRNDVAPIPVSAMNSIAAVATEQTLPAEVSAEVVTTPAWNDYRGVEADVEGYMQVVARSPEEAAAAAEMLISAAQANPLLMTPQVAPHRLLATRAVVFADLVTDADDDSDDYDGDDDDEGDDTPERHYTF